MDKEEGMLVTDDDITKDGDINDHECGSNDSEEREIGGEREEEECSDDCGN